MKVLLYVVPVKSLWQRGICLDNNRICLCLDVRNPICVRMDVVCEGECSNCTPLKIVNVSVDG